MAAGSYVSCGTRLSYRILACPRAAITNNSGGCHRSTPTVRGVRVNVHGFRNFQEMMQASPDVHAFTQDALSTAIVFCVYEPFSVSTVSRKSMTDCLPALRATSSGVRPEPSIAIGSISCSTTRYLHGDGSSGVSTLYAAPTRSRVDSRGTPPHGAAGDEALDWLT